MSAPYIDIFSAVGSVPYLGIPFPSGQITVGEPGSNLLAYLVSMRANFGFNETPHAFELDFIPSGTGYGHGASGNLPAIDTQIELWASGFFIKGFISHVDWDSGIGGTTLSISVRDRRIMLDQYKITTDDLGDNVPSGICSVPREFRLQYGITKEETRTWAARGITKTELEADDTRFLEYRRIIERGATYEQIINATDRAFGSGVVNQLPDVSDIQTNIGSDINSLRWKFGLDTYRSMISQVTLDTAFDWYWNMSEDKVALINKKIPFAIPEDRILTIINGYGGSGIENITNISYGFDKVADPTSLHILGAHQEGFMNSRLLSPIDGLDTLYDGNEAGSGILYFEGAWQTLTVGFYDANGYYRTYVPSEKELQMAIQGIEAWTYFKIYQTAASTDDPAGWGLASDAGSIAAQHSDFQSRLDPLMPLYELTANPPDNLRVIDNRRDQNSNWVLEFYSRVQQHASRHYGKSYIATHALTRDNKVFFLLDEAWTNIENQRQDSTLPFVDDYEIARIYGVVAPFFNPSSAKVSAFCVMPPTTVYGPLGEDSPSSFMDWTEDAPPFNSSGDGSHYIPVQITTVGGRVMDPRRNSDFSFEHYPEQTLWCQLPQMALSGIQQDDVLGTLATLTQHAIDLGTSGWNDIIDLRKSPIPYPVLSGVAVPVRSVDRYGAIYPSTWASGNADDIVGVKTIIEDDLSPWNEFPQGQETSVQVLDRRAKDKINSIISYQQESQFIQVGQIGLPQLSFDTFAKQTPNASGMIGEREHGVNEVNITYSIGGLKTQYKAESYYQSPRKPSPLEDRTRARLEGVIQPIDFLELGNFLAGVGRGNPTTDIETNSPTAGAPINTDFDRQEACEVISVNNIFNEAACNKILNGQSYPSEEQYYVEVTRNSSYVYFGEFTIGGEETIDIPHGLDSISTIAAIAVTDNQYQSVKFVYYGQLPFVGKLYNPSTDSIDITIMVTNVEGSIRPTNSTIRNSSEVDEAGVYCQDGYLNLGDSCVYHHKRVDGEEFAYLTGGRKLSAGQIIEVESQNDDGTYNVSLLGDRHGRWMCNIGSLNSVSVGIGTQAQIAENYS